MSRKSETSLKSYHLGNLYLKQGRFSKAEKSYLRSIKLEGNLGKTYNNLGIAQKNLGKMEEAKISLQKAIQLDPSLFEAYNNFGNILLGMDKINEAINFYEKALEINPHYQNAYNNLGTAWQRLGQVKKAAEYYHKALKINPNDIDALNNLGTALFSRKKIKSAIKTYRKVLIVEPNFIEALYNLGAALNDDGKMEESIKCAEKVISLSPKYEDAYCLLLQQLERICEWNKIKELLPKLTLLTKRAVRYGYRPGETPFFNITHFDNPKYNLQVAKLWCKPTNKSLAATSGYNFNNRKDSKVIRIGYLSGDFRNHAIANQIIDIFKLHDKKRFRIFSYSYGNNDKSYQRKTIEKYSQFRDVSKKTYAETAEIIAKDKINILIDLMGHTRGARLEIPALRPAPVQLTYLGFPGTTGADFFDYVIVDKIIAPPSVAKYYTEKFIYMPDCYQVQSYSRFKKNTGSKVKRKSLPFIFSCLNGNYKINEQIFSSWMKILKKVPNSVLWLLKGENAAINNLYKQAEKYGVNKNRLIFKNRTTLEKFLKRLTLVDLALDTHPYNGGATTSNALWAGVPVVTLQGDSYLSGMSSSLLTAAGIPELITRSNKAYENLAIKMATNPKLLKTLKTKLNKGYEKKPLFKTEIFIKNLEKSYLTIWENYLKGKKPSTIVIK